MIGGRRPVADTLATRIAAVPLFIGIGRRGIARLLRDVEWFCVPVGWTLFREGDTGEAVHVVTAGRLGALVADENGAQLVIAEIGVGETVGEMALLTDAPRSATLVALRDSELIRIPRDTFEALIDRNPGILRHLGRVLAERLNRVAHRGTRPAHPMTVAVVGVTPGADATALAHGLTAALAHSGLRAVSVGPDGAEQTADWFHAIERENDHVVYAAPEAGTPWARFCMRRADRLLLAARAGDAPPDEPPCDFMATPSRSCDLVLLHPADTTHPHGMSAWLGRFPIRLFSNSRLGHRGDIARLARLLTGRAVGLVLSGGGARGFAHIGVIRALREAGIPIDLVGGTSMGAIAAAGAAMEWSHEAFIENMRRSFVKTNPLGDYTLPLVSLVGGRRVTRRLRREFGEAGIEDLWRPFFALSANLTTGQPHLHRNGPIWRALRASIAIPGVLPPIIKGDEILVDGSVLNNFPADIMAGFDRGPVVGVDVGRSRTLGGDAPPPDGLFERLFDKLRGGRPGIVELLMRAGTVSSDAYSTVMRSHVDLLFEPPVEMVDLRDWKAFDRVVEAGYRHAADILEKAGPSPFEVPAEPPSQNLAAALDVTAVTEKPTG